MMSYRICTLHAGILMFALYSGTVAAQQVPGSAEADADWHLRASGNGVMYAINFDDVYLDGQRDSGRSGISSAADLISEALESPPTPANLALSSLRRLSGSNSIRLTTLPTDGASSGGSWSFRPDGRSATVRNNVFVQFSVYYPRETIGYRFNHSGDSYLKTFNFGQYGAGQVVVGDIYFSGFPTLLINGTQSLGSYNYSLSSSDTPWQAATTREQPAVNNGQNPTSSDSRQAWLNNYGVMPRGVQITDGDYTYKSGDPYLYQRTDMSNGWPDNRAIQGGSIPWQLDGWTTIEAHLAYNGPDDSTIQIWAAPYGEEPVLIVNEVGTAPLNSNSTNSWKRFELLNYATGRVAEATRPIQYTYYDEVIVSTGPIPFPGGYTLPGEFRSSGTGGGSDGGGSSGGTGSTTDLGTRNAPAWVTSIEPGTWETVSQNTITDVDPADDPAANPNYPGSAPWSGNTGQASVTTTWNGGAFADGYGNFGGLIAFGGGHADYYGSEIYAFDMETRNWSRLSDPYKGPFNFPYSDGVYPDGSPVPPHTYAFSGYDPQSNSYILLGSMTTLGSQTSRDYKVDVAHMFSFDTMSWRRSDHASSPRPDLQGGGWAIYDSRRKLHWAEGGAASDRMAAFDASGDNGDGTYGSWVGTYPAKTIMTDTVGDYDPKNDIIVLLPWRNDSRVAGIDLSNPDQNEVYLNITNSGPSTNSSTGFDWSSATQSFIQFGVSGSAVYQLRHVSGDWDTGSWHWSNLTAPNNNVMPQSATNGVYDRFQVVSYADAEIALLVNKVNGPVYAFRIPDEVGPKPNTNMDAQ